MKNKSDEKMFFDFFKKVNSLLYESDEELDLDSDQYYENMTFKLIPEDDDGFFMYFGYFRNRWRDSKDYSDNVSLIKSERIYKDFDKNPLINKAYKAYERIVEPKVWSIHEDEDSFERGSWLTGNQYFDGEDGDPFENQGDLKYKKMDFVRFCGFVSHHYFLYFYELRNLSPIREEVRTDNSIKNDFLGKGKPLTELVNLVKKRHKLLGLVRYTNLMHELTMLETILAEGLLTTASETGISKKAEDRFIVRVLANFYHEFERERPVSDFRSIVNYLFQGLQNDNERHGYELEDFVRKSVSRGCDKYEKILEKRENSCLKSGGREIDFDYIPWDDV